MRWSAAFGGPWGWVREVRRQTDRGQIYWPSGGLNEFLAWCHRFQPRDGPRYVFFVHVSEKIPADVTNRLTAVNFHCSPLPAFRGGHPIEHQLLAGKVDTVMTAHQMTQEIDAGPIYGTRGPIILAGTKDEILARFVEPVAELMRWIVETEPEPTLQVGEVVKFQRLTPEAYQQFWEARR